MKKIMPWFLPAFFAAVIIFTPEIGLIHLFDDPIPEDQSYGGK